MYFKIIHRLSPASPDIRVAIATSNMLFIKSLLSTDAMFMKTLLGVACCW